MKKYKDMKKIIPFILLCSLLLTACENNHSVNILIANTANQSFKQREVTIPLDTIRMWLETNVEDTLIQLRAMDEALADDQKLYVNLHPIVQSDIDLGGFRHIHPFPKNVN